MFLSVLGTIASMVVVGLVVIYSGSYNVGADIPHTAPVFAVLDTARIRSIGAHASGVQVPSDLMSEKRIRDGASEYGEMCSQCHLGPGVERSEISQGLYPRAPELSHGDPLTAAEQFWVVKHGIKFTSMPAWGPTHDDELIWSLVAFVRKLPTLSPQEYEAMTAKASEEHEHMMHEHEMPGMDMGHDHKD